MSHTLRSPVAVIWSLYCFRRKCENAIPCWKLQKMELNTFVQLSILFVRHCMRSSADYDASSHQQLLKRHIKVPGCYFSVLIWDSNMVPPTADLMCTIPVTITEWQLMWITIIRTWILVYRSSFPLPTFRPLWWAVWNISVRSINTSTFFHVQSSYTYLCCLNY